MKKQLLLLVMMLLPMVAMADAVEIDGINYNLDAKNKVAMVANKPSKYSGEVIIPESVTYKSITYSVKSIWSFAFAYCSGLTSVAIPNSVTSIGYDVFIGCTNLTSMIVERRQGTGTCHTLIC